MKFMLLFQIDEKQWASLPETERNSLMANSGQLAQDLEASGHSRACIALQPSTTATTLRLKAGKRVITDGPFAETKEMLAGFLLVECRDLNEALEIAARFPPLRVGASVEVRPVMS